MPKAAPLQGNFTGGELSPNMYGRVDHERYKIGLATCLNYLPTIQGSLVKRPGTYFVAAVKFPTASIAPFLQRFEFNDEQAYVLEFGSLYVRFFANDSQVQNAGSTGPLEVVTPYLSTEVFQLKFTQSADVLYIVHPNHPPATLSRISNTDWSYAVIDFIDGPYQDVNTTSTTLYGGAGDGTTNVTASSIYGINNNTGFQATDVGRLIRIYNGSTWGQGVITVVISNEIVTVNVLVPNIATSATTSWCLGLWYTGNYPSCTVFHEDRLFLGGAPQTPQRTDGSVSSDYTLFSPTDLDGNVADSNSVGYTLNSNDVNVMAWMVSDPRGLMCGTVAGEWLLSPGTTGGALTPTSIDAQQMTHYGSANIQAVQIGLSTILIQRACRKAIELSWFWQVNGFQGADLTFVADHIAIKQGITCVAVQKQPQTITWCVRGDGTLLAMTYERDLDALKVGWSRHVIGGFSDAAGTQAQVQSVASIPYADASYDELWMCVRRLINGELTYSIEVMTQIFDDTIQQQDAFFIDCGLTYDTPIAIVGVTNANPMVITTSAAHGLSIGQKILISDVFGMTQLNGQSYLVGTTPTTSSLTVTDLEGNVISSIEFGTFVPGSSNPDVNPLNDPSIRLMVTTVSGLSYLNGQTVAILADGAVHPSQIVIDGSVTLEIPAAVVQVGLPYNADGQLLRLEAGSADGTSIGKTRRTNRVGFMLHRSIGFKFGTGFDCLEEVTFRTGNDPGSRAVPLFTGILSETIPADYNFQNQIAWRSDQPTPSMVLAVMPQMETQDRG